jgi:hypothetical protein
MEPVRLTVVLPIFPNTLILKAAVAWRGFILAAVIWAACQRGLESAFAGRQPDDRLSSQDSSYGVLH